MRPPATFAVRVAADRATRDRMTLAVRVRRPVETLAGPARKSVAVGSQSGLQPKVSRG